MEENIQEYTEIKQTWKKIEYISKKAGLREGISIGRESNFQEYFDIGFREGFKNGYELGKYKGSLTAHCKQHSSDITKYLLPEKIKLASCQLCKDKDLINEDVSEIVRKQTEQSNKIMSDLYSTFNPVRTGVLP